MYLALQWTIMLAALRKNRLRALLALCCVAVGVGAVMVSSIMGEGAARELGRVNDLAGKNLFVVKAGQVMVNKGRRAVWTTTTRLRSADAVLLREQLAQVQEVVPVAEAPLKVAFQQQNMLTSVRGVSPAYLNLRNFSLASGRGLDEGDLDSRSRVAVIGAHVADKLNGGHDMVGLFIRVGGVAFEVVGQLAAKGMSADGGNEDDQVVIPLDTAQRRLFNQESLSSLLVQTRSEDDLPLVQARTREILREAHDVAPDAADDVEILSMVRASTVRRMNSLFLQGVSQLFAAITLTIGGAGLFAVTYLNVRDRTAEIGLRMAIGARRRDIVTLFVAETCVLSVGGGLVGLLFGLGGTAMLEALTDWPLRVRGVHLLQPLALATVLGLLVGVAPALRAARLNPIAALRAS